eukprot:TRINITY_DN112646_c0_g1_i1.p1 TRINITY_DN112646_c0_g1~~TRINITY_DN112646_c0_g1_i1.p1  ORF type:complete len:287 (-),score=70.75 TRINITY_DN112646_c0_g1_i1:158-1018(-)
MSAHRKRSRASKVAPETEAAEADNSDEENDAGLLLEGFLRFFRMHRTELVQQAGMHLLSPKIPTLAQATAEAWANLSLASQMEYHEEALRDLAKIDLDGDWISQMAATGQDVGAARTGPPPALCRDNEVVHQELEAAPPPDISEKKDDEAGMAGSAPKASRKDAGSVKRPPKQQGSERPSRPSKAARTGPVAVPGVLQKAGQRRQHTKTKDKAPAPLSEAEKAAERQELRAELEAMPISRLRGKAIFLGARSEDVRRCIEKAELVELGLQLTLNKQKEGANTSVKA